MFELDLSADIQALRHTFGDIREVETVFKQGIGYDPAKLIASVQGKAGIW